MNQAEDSPQPPSTDGFDPRNGRGLLTDGRRPPEGEFGRGQRGGDFPQPVFRNDRPPVPRQHRDTVHEDYEEGGRPMAAHPLFRGLLQELPPRGSAPSQEWLDRWSATARSILELLYSRDPMS